MDELKPCPFCGATGLAVTSGPCAWTVDGIAWNVTCHTRGCHGGIFALGLDMFATPTEAIAAWNTRPAPAEQAELVERLANLDTAYRNASNDAGHWHLKAIERKERIAELDAEIARLREDWNALFDALFDAVALIGHCMDMKTTALIGGETLAAREVWQRGHDLLLGKRARAALKETP